MKRETTASLPKHTFAATVSGLWVVSKVLTAIFKTNVSSTSNLPLAIFLITCRAIGVMSTSAKGTYEGMVYEDEPKLKQTVVVKKPPRVQTFTATIRQEADIQVKTVDERFEEVSIIGRPRIQLLPYSQVTPAKKYYQNIMGNLIMPVAVINAIVQSSLSGYASYLVILAMGASGVSSLALAGVVFTVAMFIAMYFGKNGISKTFKAFGRYLDSNKKSGFGLDTVGKFLFALCTLSSLPLSYIAIHTPLMAVLLKLGIAASLCNPIGLAVCLFLLTVTAIASVCINYSQGSKLKKGLVRLQQDFKSMQGVWQQIAFGVAFVIAAVISVATITIAVMGDVLGLKGVFDIALFPTIVFAITSGICNTAFTLSDTLSSVTMSLFYAGEMIFGGRCKVDEAIDPAEKSVKVHDDPVKSETFVDKKTKVAAEKSESTVSVATNQYSLLNTKKQCQKSCGMAGLIVNPLETTPVVQVC